MTLYEVFDTKTGRAIVKKDGTPLRTDFMSAAAVVIDAIKDDQNVIHLSLMAYYDVPDGANLDIRPVSSDTDTDADAEVPS